MKLAQIAKKLRKTMTEQEIVTAIKNREIAVIEKNYSAQKNYPHGVFVQSFDESDSNGVLFGEKAHEKTNKMKNLDNVLLRANDIEGVVQADIVDYPDAVIMSNRDFYDGLHTADSDDIFTLVMPPGTDGEWEKIDDEYGINK